MFRLWRPLTDSPRRQGASDPSTCSQAVCNTPTPVSQVHSLTLELVQGNEGGSGNAAVLFRTEHASNAGSPISSARPFLRSAWQMLASRLIAAPACTGHVSETCVLMIKTFHKPALHAALLVKGEPLCMQLYITRSALPAGPGPAILRSRQQTHWACSTGGG